MTTVVLIVYPVNQRIQDGGGGQAVLKGSHLSIMSRHHPRWWVQNGGRRKEKKKNRLYQELNLKSPDS